MGQLSATVHTKNLRGHVSRTIAVDTNDPDRPRVTLTVRVSVISSVIVMPRESVHLTNLRRGMEHAALLLRRDPSESGELTVSDPRTSADWLTASARPLEPGGPAADGLPPSAPGDWLLEVGLTGARPYGRSQQKVTFETGLSRQKEVELSVLVDLRPPVNLPVDRLLLPAPQQGEAALGTINFSLRHGVDPATLTVDAVPDTLHVEFDRSGRRGYQAQVSWPDDGRSEGTITFHVGEESLMLPVVRAPGGRRPAAAEPAAGG